MKKALLVVVALVAVAFAFNAFATDTATTTTNKPVAAATTTPTTTAKAETKATTPTELKGTITSMDATTLKVKDNANKEWAFKIGTVDCKSYKVGDNVAVSYEKDNLKTIAKAK